MMLKILKIFVSLMKVSLWRMEIEKYSVHEIVEI